MKIWLVNDDGIDAGGIRLLAGALSGEHTVTIIAPDSQRSAASKAMTMWTPLYCEKRMLPSLPEVAAYAVSGLPVDCVRVACALLSERPDIVVSGINHGANLGTDTLYSGTCGGAQEAALAGLPAIALSCCAHAPQHLETAAAVAPLAVRYAMAHPLPYGAFYNINVPDLPRTEIRGARFALLGEVQYPNSLLVRQEGGRHVLDWNAAGVNYDGDPGTDTTLSRQGYITITPLTHTDGQIRRSGEAEGFFGGEAWIKNA